MSLLWRRRGDLHQDQIHAIEGLPVTGKYLLIGPPGSGKTSILLHRGQYLRLPPHRLANVVLVTFARTLREFIALSGDDRFPVELILTQKMFVDNLFAAYGESSPVFQGTLVEQNRQRAFAITQLMDERGQHIFYDALLIDEIQDLSDEEIKLYNRLSDRIMFAGDSRQSVYSNSDIMPVVQDLCSANPPIVLNHHFRISADICLVADRILCDPNFSLTAYSHYSGPAPAKPNLRSQQSQEQQLESLVRSLDLQVDTYNEQSDLIGVVVGRQSECDKVFDRLNAEPKFAGRCGVFHSGIPNRTFGDDCKICITTIQSCKGLEFRALHWLFADDAPYLTRQKAYTVITRAKTSLTVYREGRLPTFLAGAFSPPASSLFEDDE